MEFSTGNLKQGEIHFSLISRFDQINEEG